MRVSLMKYLHLLVVNAITGSSARLDVAQQSGPRRIPRRWLSSWVLCVTFLTVRTGPLLVLRIGAGLVSSTTETHPEWNLNLLCASSFGLEIHSLCFFSFVTVGDKESAPQSTGVK
jgi:hypothetical protein